MRSAELRPECQQRKHYGYASGPQTRAPRKAATTKKGEDEDTESDGLDATSDIDSPRSNTKLKHRSEIEAEAKQEVPKFQKRGGETTGTNGARFPNVSVAAKRVFQALKGIIQINEGLHVQNVAPLLNMNVANVTKAGDELLSHSLIFTTMDGEIWAPLEFYISLEPRQ